MLKVYGIEYKTYEDIRDMLNSIEIEGYLIYGIQFQGYCELFRKKL